MCSCSSVNPDLYIEKTTLSHKTLSPSYKRLHLIQSDTLGLSYYYYGGVRINFCQSFVYRFMRLLRQALLASILFITTARLSLAQRSAWRRAKISDSQRYSCVLMLKKADQFPSLRPIRCHNLTNQVGLSFTPNSKSTYAKLLQFNPATSD